MVNVFDNFISYATLTDLYLKVKNLPYVLGWQDGFFPGSEDYLHSTLSSKEHIMFCQDLISDVRNKDKFFSELTYNKQVEMAVVNLTTYSDVNYRHAHKNFDTIIILHINPRWNINWGGETSFYNNTGTEIERCVSFVPGRLIVFNSDDVHSIKPQNIHGDKYRFTLAMFLNEK